MDWIMINYVYADRKLREKVFKAWKKTRMNGQGKKLNFDERIYAIGLRKMAASLGIKP